MADNGDDDDDGCGRRRRRRRTMKATKATLQEEEEDEAKLGFWFRCHRVRDLEGPQVNRFASLLYLAPNDSIEDVLKVLQQYAYLVQGLWVSKSSLLTEGQNAIFRDYIVFQFTKNCVIRYDKKRPPPPIAVQILAQLAVRRSFLDDWKFKEPTDFSFIKSYPDIVKEQEDAWYVHMKQLMNSLRGAGQTKESQMMDSLIRSLNPHLLKKTVDGTNIGHAQMNGNGKMARSKVTTVPNGI